MTELILASASPRRTELLTAMQIEHRVQPAAIDESRHAGESPRQYVRRLATEKAAAVYHANGPVVLAADTCVALGDDLFDKPADVDGAVATLLTLAGREHRVLSALAVSGALGVQTKVVTTRVRFRQITDVEARRYWATGEGCDKAGGYAIQGLGAAFVESIVGSYPAVVGLPIFECLSLLAAEGIYPRWQQET